MASMRRLRRRDLRWRRYARRTYWSPRVSRPPWMGLNSAMTPGHFRAWVRLSSEQERRRYVAARRYRTILDSRELVDEWPQPCQPIGCDNGFHLPGCAYAAIDAALEAGGRP